ncbi:hypothetical protein JMM63_10290 [Rhodovulum sulfidophilum]|uniref:Uncharacterized protein n=1 Tax=Rhodovulum sulfidophilum TaxID=35806 RepID=A0ABS1RZD7_RHOSU|nr:hypothetical protein [Rhodovulum sulfidophilum]MBL3595958.1 hypothetical protein [Rhodovulum sulfidophilum]MBL3610299.1 hypothetical protein [Rhodovulum sulfidophilum]MCE8457931.1 hypothetical protein [Rhodovulum sulfidophilum]
MTVGPIWRKLGVAKARFYSGKKIRAGMGGEALCDIDGGMARHRNMPHRGLPKTHRGNHAPLPYPDEWRRSSRGEQGCFLAVGGGRLLAC